MSKDKEVKIYHHDDCDEYITVARWEIDNCVELVYREEYDSSNPSSITFPALDREQFEELVKATRYVMGWE